MSTSQRNNHNLLSVLLDTPSNTLQYQADLLFINRESSPEDILDEISSKFTAPLVPSILNEITMRITVAAEDGYLEYADIEELPLPILLLLSYQFGLNVRGKMDRDLIAEALYETIILYSQLTIDSRISLEESSEQLVGLALEKKNWDDHLTEQRLMLENASLEIDSYMGIFRRV